MTIAATAGDGAADRLHFDELSTDDAARQPAGAARGGAGDVAGHARPPPPASCPGLPVEPLNRLDALLLGYIAQVAAWCGRPAGPRSTVQPRRSAALAAAYAALASRSPWRSLGAAGWRGRPRRRRRRRVGAPAAALAAGARRAASSLAAGRGAPAAAPAPAPPGRACGSTVLDVGQGDAILLQPAGAPAVLVDGGPPGDGLAAKLDDAGRRAARRRGRHPRPVRPRRRDRGAARRASRSTGSSTAASAADCSPRPRRPARVPVRSPRAASSLRRPPPRGPLAAAASCSASRTPAPTRTSSRWSCSPAGATSRCC